MENTETPFQSGNNKSDPSRSGRPTPDRNPNSSPVRRDQQDQKNFDTGNNEAEINPNKLDREPSSPDIEGEDNSKAHEPYEFKQNSSQSPQSSNSTKKFQQGSLMGQGGYGTNGSQSGYSGSDKEPEYGYKPKRIYVDINQLGKDAH